MREGALAAACALVVLGTGAIARAKPPAYHPPTAPVQLVCTTDGHRLADGDRAPIDHDVTCEIAGVDPIDSDLTPAISVAVEQPLGGTANASATMSLMHGDAFGLGSDLVRCAPTTFHATLTRGDQVSWEQSLHVRPSCKPVRLRGAAVACRRQAPRAVDCTVTVAGAPADATLDASFRRTGPDVDRDLVDRLALAAVAGGGLTATASYPPDASTCRPVRVDAAITRDGGVVWTGHTSYTPGCHPVNP